MKDTRPQPGIKEGATGSPPLFPSPSPSLSPSPPLPPPPSPSPPPSLSLPPSPVASPHSAAPPGRVAGIDFGRARIGIAISDPERRLASPYENYSRRGPEADARRFRTLAAEERIVLFVVGLPVHLDDRESAISREAREFGAWLGEVTGVPVEFFDERFSTREAHELLKGAGMKHARRKRKLDMLAAQVVLSAYLESQAGKQRP